MSEKTHKQLVALAARWLRNARILGSQCSVVISERNATYCFESPDVIGFMANGQSVLLECKVNRSDFLADKQKIFRQAPESGMGNYRVYVTLPGIIQEDDDLKTWGLYELTTAGSFLKRQEAVRQEANKSHEVRFLTSALRRVEISMAVYVKEESVAIEGGSR